MLIRFTNQIFDLDILIRSAARILDLEIIIRSADCIQLVCSYFFKTEKKHRKIVLSSFDSFCLILKIKQDFLYVKISWSVTYVQSIISLEVIEKFISHLYAFCFKGGAIFLVKNSGDL